MKFKKSYTWFLIFLLFFLLSNVSSVFAENNNTYETIKNDLLKVNKTSFFNKNEYGITEISSVIKSVLKKEDEIDYVKSWVINSNGKIDFTYHYKTEDLKNRINFVDKETSRVVNEIKKNNKSDFDKVKAVHDYIVLNMTYDYDNYVNGTLKDDAYTSYGLLKNKIGVCAGYAKLTNMLLDKLGVESKYVTGYVKNVLHAWNIVKIDGKYYYMDVTWDDPISSNKANISYNYFLVSEKQLKKDHVWDSSLYPKADSEKYSYFSELNKYNYKKLEDIGGYYYFSNSSDNNSLYKIKKDGRGKTKVNSLNMPYFEIVNNIIYFSNYSDRGYLYKSNLDGSGKELIKPEHVTNIIKSNSGINILNNKSGKTELLKITIN